jgi:voltage-gated potassium channel
MRRRVARVRCGPIEMPRLNPIERRLSRFLEEPVSVRNAASVIAVSTTLVVLASGVLMRVLDPSEYPTIGRGLWWAMQTVTTVGYGDVTPEHTSGRIVGVVVMLWGIAFVSILVAAITSTFVTRAVRERERADKQDDETAEDRNEARFDDLVERLDRVEQALSRLAKP